MQGNNQINFGTDGWRAIIADEFTFENVELVSTAIAKYAKETYGTDKPLLIGYDTRFLANKFAQRSAETICKYGLNVLIAESYSPTPAIAYAAKNLHTAGALMFTASHNPAEYCGIKYIPDYAGPATKEITDKIVGYVRQLQNNEKILETTTSASIKEFNPKPDYINRVKELIDLDKIQKAGIRICFDPLYATALGWFDEILDQAGIKYDIIHNWTDPLYGGGLPEPKPKYLGGLIELVKSKGNAVGFSNDGDADRFGVIDEKGNYVSPNEIIALLLQHLIKNKNRSGVLVKTVAASLMLDKIATKYNVPVIETPVGFKWVGEAMRENETVVGGEESGGLSIWGHIPEKDGIIANLSILELMAYEAKPLYQLLDELHSDIGIKYINNRIDLKLTEDTKNKAMEMFLNNAPQSIGGLEIKNICKKDGVKYYFDDNNSWMLVRPSGTEPLLRIYFETDSQEKLDKLIYDINNLTF